MKTEKSFRLVPGAYAAACLAIALFFDVANSKLSSIWAGVGTISDPVLRFICYLLLIAIVAGLLPGIFVALIALLALVLAALAVSWIIKAAMWLAALSPGGALVIGLVVSIVLILIIYKNRTRIVETTIQVIARIIMALRWLTGLPIGETLHDRPAMVISRVGGTLVVCGIICLMIGLRHQTPRWLSKIGRFAGGPPEKEVVIVAPVNTWSDTLQTPDSRHHFPKIVVDGEVFVQDELGNTYTYGPQKQVFIAYPKTLRWKSRTGHSVNVHIFSTASIEISAQTPRPAPKNRSRRGAATIPSVTNNVPASPKRQREMRALLDEVQEPHNAALQANSASIYQVGGRVSAPAVLYKIDPDYSPEARSAHLSGKVLVRIVVDETGAARDAVVVKSLGLGLDEKAVEAVNKWKFKPGMKDGKPVAVRATVEVNFRIG